MAVFYNQATLSYSGGTANSNITAGELVEVLSASKTALSSGYGSGDCVTYLISIVNSGETPVNGLTVSDDLGAYSLEEETLYPLSYVEDSIRVFESGVLQPAPVVTAGPPMVITGVNVPANSNTVLTYEASVTPFAPLGENETIENTATISGGGLTAPLTAQASIPMEAVPELTISKSVSPEVVTGSGPITYTFMIQNSGAAEASAADELVITDTFDPALSGITVTVDGAPWTSPSNYNYDEATGAFATVPGQITVPAATFTQNSDGSYVTSPGVAILTVSGTI